MLMLKLEGQGYRGVVEFTKGERKTERDPGWASAVFDEEGEDRRLAEAMCLQVAPPPPHTSLCLRGTSGMTARRHPSRWRRR